MGIGAGREKGWTPSGEGMRSSGLGSTSLSSDTEKEEAITTQSGLASDSEEADNEAHTNKNKNINNDNNPNTSATITASASLLPPTPSLHPNPPTSYTRPLRYALLHRRRHAGL